MGHYNERKVGNVQTILGGHADHRPGCPARCRSRDPSRLQEGIVSKRKGRPTAPAARPIGSR
jgi:hypothetical protein